MAHVEEILLPDVGDFNDIQIIEILVAEGERIAADQPILTLESDKATMEVPAPYAGVVKEICVAVGDTLTEGARLLRIERAGDEVTAADDVAADPAANCASAASDDVQDDAREANVGVSDGVTSASAEPDANIGAQSGKSAGSGEVVTIEVPDIGDFVGIPVIEVLVAPGDRIAVEQPLLTLESDKTTLEVPAPRAGVVEELIIAVGDKVSQGAPILRLRLAEIARDGAKQQSDAPAAEPVASQTLQPEALSGEMRSQGQPTAERTPGESEPRAAPVAARPDDAVAFASGRIPHASPSVRRFARELGVDLQRVDGSGPKERILKEDVQGFIKRRLNDAGEARGALGLSLALMPEIDFSRFGEIERSELPRIKRLSGAHLHRSWVSIPHVTQFDAADITELEAFRKQRNAEAGKDQARLTPLPFLLKAVAAAMAQLPIFNTSLSADGTELIHKHYTHIGVAVDTPNGLLVPVVRDVDRKGLDELASELAELGARARAGGLKPDEMRGGCFSISSLGGIGGTAFTPIVNAPEVAILGVSRAETRPLWRDGAFVPRLMLPLSLSYDHRVIDGAEAVRFTTLLARLLSDIRRLLL